MISRRKILMPAWIAMIVALSSGPSDASSAVRILPPKGGKLVFSHTYSPDYLKNHPLQMVKKTTYVLKNTKGLLTGTWTATIRDIRTDEAVEATSTAICKPRGRRSLECVFDTIAGTVNLSAESDGLRVTIPVGQGVFFSHEKNGLPWSDILLGADTDNSDFKLEAKRI